MNQEGNLQFKTSIFQKHLHFWSVFSEKVTPWFLLENKNHSFLFVDFVNVNNSEACEARKLQILNILDFKAVFRLFILAHLTTIPITCEVITSEHFRNWCTACLPKKCV